MSAYVYVWVDPPNRTRSGKYEVQCSEHGRVDATVSHPAARQKLARHRNAHGERASR